MSRRGPTPRVTALVTAIGALLALTPALSCADEPPASPKPKAVDVEFKVGTWLSTGETTWSHNHSMLSTLVGNPTSALTYKDDGHVAILLAHRHPVHRPIEGAVEHQAGAHAGPALFLLPPVLLTVSPPSRSLRRAFAPSRLAPHTVGPPP